jgi:spore maturation protein CgeB
VGAAKVALCLVRRGNRDGNCMRTFELAAMGSCMLTEDTGEHRAILGPDGEATVYFQSIPDMLAKVRWLLDHEYERQRLQAAVRARILRGNHTYRDRLHSILHLSAVTEKVSHKTYSLENKLLNI